MIGVSGKDTAWTLHKRIRRKESSLRRAPPAINSTSFVSNDTALDQAGMALLDSGIRRL